MHSIGCVSFLNSKPLIEALLHVPDVSIRFAVPSHLLDLVEAGTVSTALLSVVDYQLTMVPLTLVPAGMIGCDGPTLTVRFFSRVPIEKIRVLHGDTDSHTSIILARIILREQYGIDPEVVPFQRSQAKPADIEAMLLIGDKVVNAAPDARVYSHGLDLGEAWHRLTGLPFVFAMWMIRKDAVAAGGRDIARLLADARRRGADLTESLLDRYCTQTGWPRDLARQYFTTYLQYEVTPRARQGLANFFEMAQRQKLIPDARPLEYLELS